MKWWSWMIFHHPSELTEQRNGSLLCTCASTSNLSPKPCGLYRRRALWGPTRPRSDWRACWAETPCSWRSKLVSCCLKRAAVTESVISVSTCWVPLSSFSLSFNRLLTYCSVVRVEMIYSARVRDKPHDGKITAIVLLIRRNSHVDWLRQSCDKFHSLNGTIRKKIYISWWISAF